MLGGVALFDADGDGRLDVYFVNGAALSDETARPDKRNPTFWNRLYRKNGDGTFTDITEKAGVRGTGYGQGVAVADYDNDGFPDLFVAQGHVMDNELTQPGFRYREPLLLMKNTSRRFVDVSSQAGGAFQTALVARGAAFGDLDNDGRIDIVVATNDGTPKILRNTAPAKNWLLVNTVGTVSNRDGIGAVSRLVSKSGREQFGFVSTAGSYLSASDKRVHFGLGSDRRVKLLEIRWPSKVVQTWRDIPANTIFTAEEKALADR